MPANRLRVNHYIFMYFETLHGEIAWSVIIFCCTSLDVENFSKGLIQKF